MFIGEVPRVLLEVLKKVGYEISQVPNQMGYEVVVCLTR